MAKPIDWDRSARRLEIALNLIEYDLRLAGLLDGEVELALGVACRLHDYFWSGRARRDAAARAIRLEETKLA